MSANVNSNGIDEQTKNNWGLNCPLSHADRAVKKSQKQYHSSAYTLASVNKQISAFLQILLTVLFQRELPRDAPCQRNQKPSHNQQRQRRVFLCLCRIHVLLKYRRECICGRLWNDRLENLPTLNRTYCFLLPIHGDGWSIWT